MQFKRFVAVLPALALSTAMVVAQEPQPSSTQQPTQSTVGQPTDTDEPVFKGCVSGTKDNYVLTTSDGKSFRLHSDKDISEHVGKMVEIRGTVKPEGADRPADATAAAAPREMDVADVKSVEGSCPTDNSSAAASSDMPKTDATDTSSQAASTTQPATTEQPAASASASTETAPAASASASANTTTEPSASAEVKTEEPAASAAVSTDQSASASTDASANQATDTTATANANAEQNTASDAAQLPETASPLPLLGLLGFGATGLGLMLRRK